MASWSDYTSYINEDFYNDSVLEISKKIFEKLNSSPLKYEFISFGIINTWLNSQYEKKDILHSAYLLCDLRKPVLKSRIAHYREGEGYIDLDDEEIELLRNEGIVVDTDTGEKSRITDNIIIYFQEADNLK